MAWKMESTAGFHAIMNLLLFPMWIVSGALFPMATAHGWIKAIDVDQPADLFRLAAERSAARAERNAGCS